MSDLLIRLAETDKDLDPMERLEIVAGQEQVLSEDPSSNLAPEQRLAALDKALESNRQLIAPVSRQSAPSDLANRSGGFAVDDLFAAQGAGGGGVLRVRRA